MENKKMPTEKGHFSNEMVMTNESAARHMQAALEVGGVIIRHLNGPGESFQTRHGVNSEVPEDSVRVRLSGMLDNVQQMHSRRAELEQQAQNEQKAA